MGKITFEELCENMDMDMLRDIVSDCNGWDGSLEDYQVYSFDEEFFETFFSRNIMDAVRSVHFGNIKSWSDEYIYFNGYGNLVSMSELEYRSLLEDGKEEIVERALELYQDGHLSLDYEIEELFDEYLQEDDDEDEDED